jgi:uncharacterized protein
MKAVYHSGFMTQDGTVVRRSKKGSGKGLFATRDFASGELVAEYTGKRITTAVADTLKTRYLFEIDKDWTIDGAPLSNRARWINHACMPNCESEVDNGRIFIKTLRPVFSGEEFTFDYGEEYFKEFLGPEKCLCENCSERRSTASREAVY